MVIRAFADIPVARFTPAQSKRADLYLGDAYWIMGRAPEAAAAYVRAHLNAPEAEKAGIRIKISEALRIMTPPEIASLVALMASDPDPAARDLVETLAEPYAYDRFTLGCVLPLTGRYASYGNRALKGVELALARVTRRANSPDFKIVIKDTGGDPERAARAVRELAREHHAAAVIGSLITAETAALEAQMAGIPIVTMTQKKGITQIGDYVFRNFFTPEMQVRALVAYCSRTLGLDRFAILYPDEPYGKTFMNLFWDAVLDANGTIVGVETYDKNRTDFADPIKKLVGLFYELPGDLKNLGRPPEDVPALSGSGFDTMLMDPAGTWAGSTVDAAGRFSAAPAPANASETP